MLYLCSILVIDICTFKEQLHRHSVRLLMLPVISAIQVMEEGPGSELIYLLKWQLDCRRSDCYITLYGFGTNHQKISLASAGIFKQSMGARNRLGMGLSYRPARLQVHSLAELVPWNRFMGSLKVEKFGLSQAITVSHALHLALCPELETNCQLVLASEPVFVNLWRSPGIDSQPARPVRQLFIFVVAARQAT